MHTGRVGGARTSDSAGTWAGRTELTILNVFQVLG
jgi:hypothetical protein